MKQNEAQFDLTTRIMRQVHDAWLFRRLRAALLIRLVALAAVLVIGGVYVSYGNILDNMGTIGWHAERLGVYFADALGGTPLVVKMLAGLAGVLGVLLLWDAGRFIGWLIARIMASRESNLSRAHEFYK